MPGRGLFRHPPQPQPLLQRRATVRPVAAPVDYVSSVLADTPVAYWRLGEPSGNPQDSAGTNHVTSITGAPTYGLPGVSGDANTSMTFGGSAGLSVPWSASLQLGDNFSFEFWVKHGVVGAIQGVIQQDFSGAENTPEIFFDTTDQIRLYAPNGAGSVEFGPVVNDSIWRYLVITKSGATSHWYRDGSVLAPDPGTANTFTSSAADPLLIASERGPNNFLNGSLDEVAVYNYALTSGQIAARFAFASPPSSSLETYPYLGGGYYPN